MSLVSLVAVVGADCGGGNPSILIRNPAGLTCTVATGGSCTTDPSFELSNDGATDTTLHWSYSIVSVDDCGGSTGSDWIDTVAPLSGSLAEAATPVSIGAIYQNISGCGDGGPYTAQLEIIGNTTNTPQRFPVSLAVNSSSVGITIDTDLGVSQTAAIGPKWTAYFDILDAVGHPSYTGDKDEADNLKCALDIDSTDQATLGTWPTSGFSKESFVGRCYNSAFTFECPIGGGNVTYTAALTVTDSTGGTATELQTIQCFDIQGVDGIADSESVCIDIAGGGHDGCPAGVNQETYADLEAALTAEIGSGCTSGCEAVYVSASAWPMSNDYSIPRDGPGRIIGVGAVGDDWATYDPPAPQGGGAGWSNTNKVSFDCPTCGRGAFAIQGDNDWKVQGVSFENPNTCSTVAACNAEAFRQGIFDLKGGTQFFESIDNISRAPLHFSFDAGGDSNGVSGSMEFDPINTDGETTAINWLSDDDSWLLGFHGDRNRVLEHGVRTSGGAVGVVIMDNYFTRWGQSKSCIAFRTTVSGGATEFGTLARNTCDTTDMPAPLFDGSNGIQVGPQNDANEIVRNNYIAQNFGFFPEEIVNIPFNIQGPLNTVEHNVVHWSAAGDNGNGACFKATRRGSNGPNPDNVTFINNTCWVDGWTGSINLVAQGDCSPCGPSENNLGGSNVGTMALGSSTVGSSNSAVASDFINATGSTYFDFLLNANEGSRSSPGPFDIDFTFDGSDPGDDAGIDSFP